ncbi:efflux RND transporter periplasmic adaptor subunit [Dinghuibacter silviterrae]|uniref:RND family efflux transporter MFP subunit n=1 Tax=Dinghuibacter silviterrae TaxID=1539049 RepID=A0A4V3GLU8_9BACT|nr:efflux RND transporter periplasmic adaptor subunit [Dinghuibacter silviterrae]TDX00883.1 RND family efflux transporter MFP subunit [Dinghuibacter silviterrae]
MNKLYFLASLLLLYACGGAPAAPAITAPDTVAVHVIPIQKGQLTTTMTLPGQLLPYQSVDLYAKVNSFVKAVFVDVGSKVHQGQLLATLEAPELEAATDESAALLHTQEALYRASKATYERLYATSKIPGTISPNELDVAKAKMGSDSANLAAARSRYQGSADLQQYLSVRAPFDGVISALGMYPGAYAGPAGKGSTLPLMTLQEQARLRLVIAVPEAATVYFHENDTVHFTVQTLPGRSFAATVARMAGSLDPQLRTEQLQMDVSGNDKTLLPGMFAQVTIDMTNGHPRFIVPTSAVTGNSEGTFVIRVSDGLASWVDVQKGREASGRIEIYGDLREGDRIVAGATDELKNGTPVRVQP